LVKNQITALDAFRETSDFEGLETMLRNRNKKNREIKLLIEEKEKVEKDLKVKEERLENLKEKARVLSSSEDKERMSK
jgi:hypothetical protein